MCERDTCKPSGKLFISSWVHIHISYFLSTSEPMMSGLCKVCNPRGWILVTWMKHCINSSWTMSCRCYVNHLWNRILFFIKIWLISQMGPWWAAWSFVSESLQIQGFSPNCTLYVEKAMAPLSSTLSWKIPWMEEPGRLQSMGSLRVGHDWATSLSLFTFMHWRRKWQPTLVFFPGESQGRGSLVGCCLWGRTESDTTEAT